MRIRLLWGCDALGMRCLEVFHCFSISACFEGVIFEGVMGCCCSTSTAVCVQLSARSVPHSPSNCFLPLVVPLEPSVIPEIPRRLKSEKAELPSQIPHSYTYSLPHFSHTSPTTIISPNQALFHLLKPRRSSESSQPTQPPGHNKPTTTNIRSTVAPEGVRALPLAVQCSLLFPGFLQPTLLMLVGSKLHRHYWSMALVSTPVSC